MWNTSILDRNLKEILFILLPVAASDKLHNEQKLAQATKVKVFV